MTPFYLYKTSTLLVTFVSADVTTS